MAPGRVCCLFFACAACAFSQATSSSGEVRGLLVDSSGGAIASARVCLTRDDQGFSRSALAGTDGTFTFSLIPSGVYRVRAEASGFTHKVLDGVEVRVGDIVSLRIPMDVSSVETEVVVNADVAVVETERTQQANTIEQRRIQNVPINRRKYLDFALLAPGVVETTNLVDDTSFRPAQTPNSGLSFGGSNGRGNGFYIDGVENYNLSGGVRPSG